MHNQPNAFVPLDPGRINPMDPIELDYWCRQLGCTREQLEAAIERAGEHVAKVREVLHGGSSPGR